MNSNQRIIRVNSERHMVVTPKFRVSFPSVFKARAFQDAEGATKTFSLDMIFESKDDFKTPYTGKKIQTVSMAKAVANAKVDQWGENKAKWPTFANPIFKDGNARVRKDGEPMDGYAGKWFVTAKSGEKFPPKVVDLAGRPIGEDQFYGGCYAIAQLLARPYAFGKNFGVRFLVNQIQKVADGERFGGFETDVFDVKEAGDDFAEETGKPAGEDEDF